MATRLVPCAACARHIKESESACPFCGAVAVRPAAEAVRPMGRLSRAALLAIGAAGALAATDCSSSSAVPLYGGSVPPEDSGLDGAADLGDGEARGDSGFAQPVYGAMVPPEDASADAGAAADAGDAAILDGASAQPLYGAVAPHDAGFAALYGGFPTPLYGGFAPPGSSGH